MASLWIRSGSGWPERDNGHISILEQEFERRAITVISFGVLASEFHAESKNTNLFAGERHEFFGQKTKGGTLTVENFQ